MALITDLLAYYKLDETSGTITDSHGSNHGTNNGADYGITGVIGTCLDFELSQGDYVALPNLDLVNATIIAWVKGESFTAGRHGICATVNSAGNSDYAEVSLCTSGNKVECQIGDGAADHQQVFTSTFALSTATWYFLAVTVDGSNITIYRDADTPQSVTQTVTPADSGEIYTIGRFGAYNGLYFDGLIDEVGIWNEALSAAQIAELYNLGSGLAYPFTSGTNLQLNIGDAWKTVSGTKINIGDAWKDVASQSINIGDAWKTIY